MKKIQALNGIPTHDVQDKCNTCHAKNHSNFLHKHLANRSALTLPLKTKLIKTSIGHAQYLRETQKC